MKKFGLLFLLLISVSLLNAQDDGTGSTLNQPVRTPVEYPWKQVDIGEFSEPVPFPHQRQADVMYYHVIWRTIDLREKMNHPLYFPTDVKGTWRSLAQVIFDALDLENPENVDALPIYEDQYCTTPKTREEVQGALINIKRVPQFDPESGEVIGEIEIPEPHEAKEVLSYNIKEVWFFDKQTSTYKVRILEIEPIIEYERVKGESEYDNGDNETEAVAGVLTKIRLGYIYYEELRPYLAQQEVYNMKNNASRMSLDDLLTFKRMFSSYIIAENNVYSDRPINEYIANARDQMLESEKITNDLRIFESDLWEF